MQIIYTAAMYNWNLPKRACTPSILSFLNTAKIIITVTGITAAITCNKRENDGSFKLNSIYLLTPN